MQTLIIILSFIIVALASGLVYFYSKFQTTWVDLKSCVLQLLTISKERDEFEAKLKELTSNKE